MPGKGKKSKPPPPTSSFLKKKNPPQDEQKTKAQQKGKKSKDRKKIDQELKTTKDEQKISKDQLKITKDHQKLTKDQQKLAKDQQKLTKDQPKIDKKLQKLKDGKTDKESESLMDHPNIDEKTEISKDQEGIDEKPDKSKDRSNPERKQDESDQRTDEESEILKDLPSTNENVETLNDYERTDDESDKFKDRPEPDGEQETSEDHHGTDEESKIYKDLPCTNENVETLNDQERVDDKSDQLKDRPEPDGEQETSEDHQGTDEKSKILKDDSDTNENAETSEEHERIDEKNILDHEKIDEELEDHEKIDEELEDHEKIDEELEDPEKIDEKSTDEEKFEESKPHETLDKSTDQESEESEQYQKLDESTEQKSEESEQYQKLDESTEQKCEETKQDQNLDESTEQKSEESEQDQNLDESTEQKSEESKHDQDLDKSTEQQSEESKQDREVDKSTEQQSEESKQDQNLDKLEDRQRSDENFEDSIDKKTEYESEKLEDDKKCDELESKQDQNSDKLDHQRSDENFEDSIDEKTEYESELKGDKKCDELESKQDQNSDKLDHQRSDETFEDSIDQKTEYESELKGGKKCDELVNPTVQEEPDEKSKKDCTTKTGTKKRNVRFQQDENVKKKQKGNKHKLKIRGDTQTESEDTFLDAYDRPVRSQRAKKNYKKKLRKQIISLPAPDSSSTQPKYAEATTSQLFWPSFQSPFSTEMLSTVYEYVGDVEGFGLTDGNRQETEFVTVTRKRSKKHKLSEADHEDEDDVKTNALETNIIVTKPYEPKKKMFANVIETEKHIAKVDKKPDDISSTYDGDSIDKDKEELTDTDRYTTADDMSTTASQITLENIDEIVYESVGTRCEYIKPEIRSRILNLVTTKKPGEEIKLPPVTKTPSQSPLVKSSSSTVGSLVKRFEKLKRSQEVISDTENSLATNVSHSEGDIQSQKQTEHTFTDIKKIFSKIEPNEKPEDSSSTNKRHILIENENEEYELIVTEENSRTEGDVIEIEVRLNETESIDIEIEDNVIRDQESYGIEIIHIESDDQKTKPSDDITIQKHEYELTAHEPDNITLSLQFNINNELIETVFINEEGGIELQPSVDDESQKYKLAYQDDTVTLQSEIDNEQTQSIQEVYVELQSNIDDASMKAQFGDEDVYVELQPEIVEKDNVESLSEVDTELEMRFVSERESNVESEIVEKLVSIGEEISTMEFLPEIDVSEASRKEKNESESQSKADDYSGGYSLDDDIVLKSQTKIDVDKNQPSTNVPDDDVKSGFKYEAYEYGISENIHVQGNFISFVSTSGVVETKEIETETSHSDGSPQILTLHQDMNFSDTSSIDVFHQLPVDQLSVETDSSTLGPTTPIPPPPPPVKPKNFTKTTFSKKVETKPEMKPMIQPRRRFERPPMFRGPPPYYMQPSTSAGIPFEGPYHRHPRFRLPPRFRFPRRQPPPPPPPPTHYMIMPPPIYFEQYPVHSGQQATLPKFLLQPELAYFCPMLLYNPYRGMSQCYTNVNYALFKQIIFEIQIVLNRLILRSDQTLYYLEDDRVKVIRGQSAEHPFHLKYLLNDMVITIQHLHNLLINMVGGDLAGQLPYMSTKTVNLLRMKFFCNDVRKVSVAVQPMTGKIVKDLFYGEISQNSEMAVIWQYDIDNVVNSLLSLCQLCDAQSYTTLEYTNVPAAVLHLEPVNEAPVENQNIPGPSTSTALDTTPNTEVTPVVSNVTELITDPYLQNLPSTSTDSQPSQWVDPVVPTVTDLLADPYLLDMPSTSADSQSSQWLSTFSTNNTFSSDNYNTQFEEITKVNISEAEVVPASNNYQTFQEPTHTILPRNVIEIYDVPPTYVYRDIYSTFYEYLQFYEASFHRVTETNGLLVLRNIADANSILSRPWPRIRVRDMNGASMEAKNKCLILGLREYPDPPSNPDPDLDDN